MLHKLAEKLSFIFLLAGAFFLPWQTKLIWLPSWSNYWEVSFFVAVIFICLFVIFFILSGRLSRFDLRYILEKERPLLLVFLILLLAAFVSAGFSSLPILSLYRWFLILLAVIFFYSLRKLPDSWRWYFIGAILLSLLVQALIGLFQFYTQISFVSSWLGMAVHHAGDLGAAVIETADGRWLRAYGASDHPNVFGGLMALGALISLYLILNAHFTKVRPVFLVLYFLFLSALLVSFSRAALVALAVGLLLMAWEWRLLRRLSRRTLLAFLALSFLVLSLFAWQYSDLFSARANLNNRLETMSLNERAEFNQRAWRDFRGHPFFGVGLGASTFFDYSHSIDYGRPGYAWKYQPAHDYWLLVAAEGGLIFVGAWLFIWLMVYKKSREHRLFGLLAAVLFLSLFDHWLFSLPLSVFWLLSLFALI
ncbi:MAG: O-antigen ligase family protein [Patescibacteria group bacterium]|nr:O-antigen ligase family protein [Patescibacteria group bacterium]